MKIPGKSTHSLLCLMFAPSVHSPPKFEENNSENGDSDSGSSDSESLDENDIAELTKTLPQSTDRTIKILDDLVEHLPSKWKNYTIRLLFGVLMLLGFTILIFLGPIALLILLCLIETKCFDEVMCIGYAVHKVERFPWFQFLAWYFFIVANYYFFGKGFVNVIDPLFNQYGFVYYLVTYHKFISFLFYIGGFGVFAFNYKKKHIRSQFSLLCWIHVVVAFLTFHSYLGFQSLLKGLIWVIVPSSMVICNDIMAYVFGFFFGRTPLIQLSPKKTWEGFIGGGVSTIVFGAIISFILSQYKYFICPVSSLLSRSFEVGNCIPSPLFQPQYKIPFLSDFLLMVGFSQTAVCPFVLHSLSLSLFCSLIAPFGGFFASGFKRAFKVKDFGNIIPGHGGAMDRFDCQFITFSFTYAYIATFIEGASFHDIWNDILHLSSEQQHKLFHELNDALFINDAA